MRRREFLSKLVLLLVSFLTLGGCGSDSSALSKILPSPEKGITNPASPGSNLPSTDKEITNPTSPSSTGQITGYVYLWQGDFMPIVDSTPRGKITPVRREILVYRAVTFEQLQPYSISGTIYSQIPTELVATATSNDAGYYEIAVPPGSYSLIVKEPGGYYANGGNYVVVGAGSLTFRRIDITYQATF